MVITELGRSVTYVSVTECANVKYVRTGYKVEPCNTSRRNFGFRMGKAVSVNRSCAWCNLPLARKVYKLTLCYSSWQSQDSAVGIVIGLRARQPESRGSLLRRGKRYLGSPKRPDHIRFPSIGIRGLFPGCKVSWALRRLITLS